MKNRVGRNRGKRRLILCVALLCAIMLFATACSSEAEENSQSQTPNASSEQQEPNAASPSLLGEFESVDLEGNTVDESILADHQLTMINVWATFCGPCINEMPDLGQGLSDRWHCRRCGEHGWQFIRGKCTASPSDY